MKKVAVFSVVLGMAVLMAAGCATTAKGPSDEEQIRQRVEEGLAGLKAKNYDLFGGMVSESFSSGAVGDKNDLLDYLKNADDMGFLDGLEVSLEDAVITVEGETATVEPVDASGSFGSLSLSFTGVREKGVWMVSGVEPGY